MVSNDDFFARLNHVLDFQLNDLKAVVSSVKAPFLVACGCLNTIEFMGGIRNGKLGKPDRGAVEARFKEGAKLVGLTSAIWRSDSKPVDENTMWQLRNGLTHQYIPAVDNIAAIMIHAGDIPPGSTQHAFRDGTKGVWLLVDVDKLVRSIEQARDTLIAELRRDSDKKERAEQALSRLPRLL